MAEVPGETARKRFAPIKTDGIVSLRHCEITRDFGGRFDPKGVQDPSPFEVEVADFIGQNNWILTENIGKFEENEITDEIIQNSPVELEEKEENGKKFYCLPLEPSDDTKKAYGRRNRLKAFLEVLLKERYVFPRSATNLHQPHYYYAVILLTERLLPLFAYVDYELKEEKIILNIEKLKKFASLLEENEEIIIVDFECNSELLKSEIESLKRKYENEIQKLKKDFSSQSEKIKELENELKHLSSIQNIIKVSAITEIIKKIIEYLMP